jgi:hypothetical protein
MWDMYGGPVIDEVELDRGIGYHGDGYDGALELNVTGTNIIYTSSFHFSTTYAAVIQNIAITNTGGSASTFMLNSFGDLGSDGSTRWHYTSSTNSYYTISSDNASSTTNGSDPVISFFYGNNSLNSYTTSMPFTNGNDYASFTVSNVPIAAGATVRFLIIGGVGNIDDDLSNQPNQALIAIQNLENPANWPADFTNLLSPTEKNQIMNWAALGTLPVTWIDFTARLQNNKTLLNWSTASELNSRDYVIQHSTSGSNWTVIGNITAAGMSTTTNQYNFVHPSPVNGNNYYRILQRDIDGKSSYSKTVSLQVNAEANLQVYQNLITDNQLRFQLLQGTAISLYNNEGRLVLKQQVTSGYQQINISHLAKGIYYLKTDNESKKIVLQ